MKMYREDRDQRNKRTRDWHKNNPSRSYMLAAKRRAQSAGLPFDLEEGDIVFPETCPILGIPIVLEKTDGPRKRCDNTPSLDRKVPAKGYVKDNVCVISWRANRLKNDATLEELEAIVKYLKESS
jgi:hypothetical protein